MKLIVKAQLFYKLAIIGPAMETIPNWQEYNAKKQEYDHIMATLPGQPLRDAELIFESTHRLYRRYDFFKLDKLMDILSDILLKENNYNIERIQSDLQYLKMTRNPEIDQQFNRLVIHKYVENYLDKLDIVGYLSLEKVNGL